jgi:ribonuclease BN (tRNA processing enzyme)
MRIIFLGTGGYHPNERRHTAGVLFPELGLLLDAGTGTFRLPALTGASDVTVALSHAHLDHVCGLTYLLVPLKEGRLRRLRVLAAPPVLAAVRDHLFAKSLFPAMLPAEWTALADGIGVDVGPGAVLHHQRLVSHPGGSRAFRLDWREGGRSRAVAYVTDTSVDGSYTEFIRGVDLLIHECYFHDDDRQWAAPTGHAHTLEVAQLARDAGAVRLLLTHIDPLRTGDDPVGLDAARAIFPASDVAADLQETVV